MPANPDEISARILMAYFQKWSAASRALHERSRWKDDRSGMGHRAGDPLQSGEGPSRQTEVGKPTDVDGREPAGSNGDPVPDHRDIALKDLCDRLEARRYTDLEILEWYLKETTSQEAKRKAEARRKAAKRILTLWYLESLPLSFSCGHPVIDPVEAASRRRWRSIEDDEETKGIGQCHRMEQFLELVRFDRHYLHLSKYSSMLEEAIPIGVDPIRPDERAAFLDDLRRTWQAPRADDHGSTRSNKMGFPLEVQRIYRYFHERLQRALRPNNEHDKRKEPGQGADNQPRPDELPPDREYKESDAEIEQAMVEDEFDVGDPWFRKMLTATRLYWFASASEWARAYHAVLILATTTKPGLRLPYDNKGKHGAEYWKKLGLPYYGKGKHGPEYWAKLRSRADAHKFKKSASARNNPPLHALVACLLLLEKKECTDRMVDTMAKCVVSYQLSTEYGTVRKRLKEAQDIQTKMMMPDIDDCRNWPIIEGYLRGLLAPPGLYGLISEGTDRAYGFAEFFASSDIARAEGIRKRDLVPIFRR